jgi:hypothetical protein
MRKELLAGLIAVVAVWPSVTFGQRPAEEGFREGGRVGGPAGAIVGGTIGTAVELPGDVLGFVTGHPRRYDRVREEVVIGAPLPRTVHVYTIPRHREYVYAYVNDRRVIAEPRTRKVIKIVE